MSRENVRTLNESYLPSFCLYPAGAQFEAQSGHQLSLRSYTDFSQVLQIIGGILISNQGMTTSCHTFSSHPDILCYIARVTDDIVGYSGVAQATTLRTCIWEVASSNHGWDTCHLRLLVVLLSPCRKML
jgi:hypothetical protein